MDSLHKKLNALIELEGVVSYQKIANTTIAENYKVSTAERRLRKSESPCVKAITKKGQRGQTYIEAYEWIGKRIPIIGEVNAATGSILYRPEFIKKQREGAQKLI